MGNSQTIVLQLHNGANGQSVYPGTYLQGVLHLNVPSGVEIGREGIHLSLFGQERAKWSEQHGSGEHRRTVRYDERFPVIQTQRYQLENAFPSRRIQGQYSLPFNFLVPAMNLPPTFAAPFKNGRCSVNYKLCAELHVSGMMKRNLRHTAQVFIAPRPPPNLGEMLQPSQMHGEKDVMFCCCFNKGRIALTAQLGRKIFESRETIVPLLTVQNDSESVINAVKIRIQRELHVRRRNRHSHDTITSVNVPQKFEAGSGATQPFTVNVGINIPTSQLSFSGQVMECRYMMYIDCDVPMASDLRIALPLQITAAGSLANVFNQMQQQQAMVQNAGMAPGMAPGMGGMAPAMGAPGSMVPSQVPPPGGMGGEMKSNVPPPDYAPGMGEQQGGYAPPSMPPNAPTPEYGDVPPPAYDEVGYDSDDEDAKQPAGFNPSAPPPGWTPQKLEPVNWDNIAAKPGQ